MTELPDGDGLAERVCLSKYHLMRLFRSGVNVTDACFQVGYGSYSSFFRAYVKQFGVSSTDRDSVAVRESSYE